MRHVVMLVLVACGGGSSPPDPHEITDCDPGAWMINNEDIPTCEIACANGATPATDADGDNIADECTATVGRGSSGCPEAFYVEFEAGQRGCCLPDFAGGTVEEMTMLFDPCTEPS